MASKIVSFIFNVVVIVGFSYQVCLVCNEYFKYPTITSVTITEALPQTNIPQVAFCTPFNDWRGSFERKRRRKSYTEKFQEQLMESPPDGSHPGGDPTPMTAWMSMDPRTRFRKRKINGGIEFKRFLLRKQNCFSVKTRRPVNWSPDVLLRDKDELLFYIVNVKMPFTSSTKRAVPGDIYYIIYMTSYDLDFDSPLRGPLVAHASQNHLSFTAIMSFSQRVARLAPPPYDTECQDYRKDGLVSRYSCEKRCINEYTLKRHNLIFEDHVIERDRHLIRNNSLSSSSASSFLRSIPEFIKYEELTEKHIEHKLNQLGGNYSKYLSGIFQDVIRRVDFCKRTCSRPDCETEYIIPSWTYKESLGENKNFSLIFMMINPPKEPVIAVTSKGKLMLLDFVIYILSCMSFWFGFCPMKTSSVGVDSKVVTTIIQRIQRANRIGYKSHERRPFEQSKIKRLSNKWIE